MPERLAAFLCGIDGDFKAGIDLALADHVAHPLRAQIAIILWFVRRGLEDLFAHENVLSSDCWSTEVYHWRSNRGNCILGMTGHSRVPCSRERQLKSCSPKAFPLAWACSLNAAAANMPMRAAEDFGDASSVGARMGMAPAPMRRPPRPKAPARIITMIATT